MVGFSVFHSMCLFKMQNIFSTVITNEYDDVSIYTCEAVCADITYISEGEVPTGRLEVHEPVLTDSPVDSHLTHRATRT